ncbi:MAG: ATPase central domain protein [Mycobacterium sp.]|jgi:cell division protease FtsH|nr:ATPase central domain protein [Mycobacterium sp.]
MSAPRPTTTGPAAPAAGGRPQVHALLGAGAAVVDAGGADVGQLRERRRRRRLRRLIVGTAVVIAALSYYTATAAHPFSVHIDWLTVAPLVFFGLLIATMGGGQWAAGRSPHVMYRPEQLDVRLDDVLGIEPVKEEVVRSLNLFLAHRTFTEQMGGTARRGLLFDGPPGTGKTHLAKAMAAEAGVPFLFVSATAFPSMFHGATARKVRSYFKAVRRAALREGGAIAFIEEIDAIGMSRGGLAMTAAPTAHAATGTLCCGGLTGLPSVTGSALGAGTLLAPSGSGIVNEGQSGIVNELLVQMQSFDSLTMAERARGAVLSALNLLLPPQRQRPLPTPAKANVLVIAATNRGESLDPALLRPGRFDRRLTFQAPDKPGRRALVDYYLGKKAHEAELDTDERRDALAAVTTGFTPVRIENLMDEALVMALRRGATAMSWRDVEAARLLTSVGLGQATEYTPHERRLIATHEAGHTVMAYLVAPRRRLEVVSIIKRGDALGLLAHGDTEDVFTRSGSELTALVQIAFGGLAAEEIFYGDTTTGPAGDLLYATGVAAEMVGTAGMTGSYVSYAAAQDGLGGRNTVARIMGDAAGRAALDGVLDAAHDVAVRLLGENRHLVEALRDALVERSELVEGEILAVLDEAGGRPVLDLRDPAPAVRG